MNTLIKRAVIVICVMGTLLLDSCKRTAFVEQNLLPSKVFFDQPGGVAAASPATGVTRTVDQVSVPVEITISGAAPETFAVNLVKNGTAPGALITSQSLIGTVALPVTSFTVPTATEIRFGVKKASFNVLIPIDVFEKNFGKKLALAIDLDSPTKGNSVEGTKKTVVVMINTSDVIALSDVHYVSFVQAGIFGAGPGNTTTDGLSLTIPLQLNLTGVAGASFSTKLVSNQDTVNKLIASGALPNVKLLGDGALTIPQTATFALNLNTASVTLSARIADILVNYGTKYAFAVTLTSPDRYQIQSGKTTVVVVIDPAVVIDNISLLLKNTTQPFTYSSLDPTGKRWGVLSDWTSNAAMNTYKGVVSWGTYDANNSTNIAIEAFSPDRPNITNGKIYQTLSLPAGKYRMDVNLRSGSAATTGNAYCTVAQGAIVPDANLVPTTSLGFVRFTATAGLYSVPFTVATAGQVSMGFSATIIQSNSYNINNVKLYRVF